MLLNWSHMGSKSIFKYQSKIMQALYKITVVAARTRGFVVQLLH